MPGKSKSNGLQREAPPVLLIVVVVLFMPKGIAGVLRDRLARWKRSLA